MMRSALGLRRGGRSVQSLRSTMVENLEDRRLLAAVTLDPATTYQTIQGWGVAPNYPSSIPIATAGTIMRDAGFNTVRVLAGPGEFTYTTGGNLTTVVPLSSDLNANVAKFGGDGMTNETDLIKWLEANALEPDRVKMIGALWSPPHWMKISTGTQITWTDNGVQKSAYDPVLPWGDYGGNTAGGRVNPTMWTDWARFVLSDVKAWEQKAGIPMYAFSFQNEPDVQVSYNSAFFGRTAVDPNDPTKGTNTGQWQLYGDALQALATELASHPEMTTKFFGPELEALGPAANNPWFLSQYFNIRQNLLSRGLLGSLGGYATHQYQYAKDGDAAVWDAFYNGSAHAAQILSNGTSSTLGWLPPQQGVAGDNKEIWQTETEGEDQTWTKDGAMAFGLKIYDSLVFGNVSGYTSWMLTGYNAGDTWGLVQLNDINNPTNSYKYDAFKQFSRWIRPGAQRINATFENGKASIGGANELDTYNGLNVAAFNHAQDKRLTMVFTNMQTTDQSTTITIPAGMNVSSFQVYVTSGTQKYVQLADLVPSNGQITLTVPASSFVTITGNYTTLPAGWSSGDIGAPALAGSSSFDSGTGTFTLLGSGSDIWGSSDQFQFAQTSANGNGQMTARVTSVSNTDVSAKAGVMFRDSTAANAAYAFAWVSPSNKVVFETRASNGTYSNSSNSVQATAGSPVWVRLVRSGGQFSAYYSQDGATWTQVGTTQSVTMATNALGGLAVTSHTNSALCTGTFTGVQFAQTNQAPTVATAASASTSPVTGTTTNLSVLGADDAGEANLTYTWLMLNGAAAVTFSTNGTNAAKNTTANFTKAGTYNLQVTITDAGGLSTTSSVTVTVNQTLSSIAITPGWVGLASHGQQQYAATAYDQFGIPLAIQPTFTWAVLGSGSIGSTGLYTAPYASASAGVQATSGTVSSNAWITVTNATPTVATAAAASPSPVTGTTTNLSVLGADDAGEANLSYTWATTGTPPAAVSFSADGTNAAKSTTATFTKAGTYSFTVTITDAGGLSTTSSVTVTVNQTLTGITVSPATATVAIGATQQFAATAYDQFGMALTTQPSFAWSLISGSGTVSSSGLYAAPATSGSATVQAASGGRSATARVTIQGLFTSNVDIGSPSPAGSGSYNASTGTYTVAGGGADIWNTSDQFHFISRSYSGDGSIVARVTAVKNTNTWAKAGVMFRNSTAANAMYADMVVSASSGVAFQWRSATGGGCGNAQTTGIAAPAWVKLVRSGNSFTAFYATTTGTPATSDWKQVGTAQTIAMSSAAQVGLAVTSHANGTLCTSTFTGVALSRPVSLAGSFNAIGMYANGATFTNANSLDGAGYAFSSTLLGSSVSWNGGNFLLGSAAANDVVSATGQTIGLPAGNYSTLQFLATAVNGSQANQTFTVTYTDGTTQTFTQGISDWGATTTYSGESVAASTAYRNQGNGTQNAGAWKLYGYSFTLNSSKTVQSITLPNDASVKLFAIDLLA